VFLHGPPPFLLHTVLCAIAAHRFLTPSIITVPGSFAPASAQRHGPTIVLCHSTSTPNMRSPPSSGEAGTSPSSSSSRFSYSHPEWRPHEFPHQPCSHITPLAPVHDHGRSRRSTFEPIAAPAPAPASTTAPVPGLEFEEEISENMEVMARRLEENT
jgi:hypothetical protein